MSARGTDWRTRLDRLSLLAMAASVGLMLQPWWGPGLRVGFFATAASTLLQIVVAHLARPEAT